MDRIVWPGLIDQTWAVFIPYLASAVVPKVIDWLKGKWSVLKDSWYQKPLTFAIVFLVAGVISALTQLLGGGGIHFDGAAWGHVVNCGVVSIGLKQLYDTKLPKKDGGQ